MKLIKKIAALTILGVMLILPMFIFASLFAIDQRFFNERIYDTLAIWMGE